MNLAPSDVASVFGAAYGDELEKEAMSMDGAKAALKTARKYVGDKAESTKEAVSSGYESAKKSLGKAKDDVKLATSKPVDGPTQGNADIKDARKRIKDAVAGGAKSAAKPAALVAGGYGAAKMFGNDDKNK